MDYKYIEQLLQRYWECETTLQEEGILRNFFAQNDVPEHLLPYRAIFQEQEKMSAEHLPASFDERILSLIKDTSAPDAKIVEMSQPSVSSQTATVKARKVRFAYRVRPLFKAAAMVAIVLCISMAMQQAISSEYGSSTTINMQSSVLTGAPETAYDSEVNIVTSDSLKASLSSGNEIVIERN